MIEIKLTRHKNRGRMKEFSKKALCAMIILWFVGALFGFLVVSLQVWRADMAVGLSDLLLYIGAPMTGGIVSYMLKSAAENKEKIKGENVYGHAEDQAYQP